MTKKEFIDRVATVSCQTRTDAAAVSDAVFTAITEVLQRSGDSVNIPGFGIFAAKERPAHTGRNPATGETVEIPAKRVVVFKPSKSLKDLLNT